MILPRSFPRVPFARLQRLVVRYLSRELSVKPTDRNRVLLAARLFFVARTTSAL